MEKRLLRAPRSLALTRLLSALLALALVFCLVPTALAEGDSFEISTGAELVDIIARMNSGELTNVTISLKNDVDAFEKSQYGLQQLYIKKGTMTILGCGHKLDVYQLTLCDTATLYLGGADVTETLTLTSSEPTESIIHLNDSASLYLYDNVTLCDSEGRGQAGGIQAINNSTVYMYGGTISNCFDPYSVAGGVMLDGSAHFYMYGGTVTGCSGLQGGAFGIVGNAVLEMHGGTISNCTDSWFGGGGVSIYSGGTGSFLMTDGTITGCAADSDRYGYGGAIFVYTTDGTCSITGGTINNSTAKIGGGVMVLAGTTTIDNGVALCNNTADQAGDDIYVNEGATLSLGTLPKGLLLAPCGDRIDGWYDDGETRWNVHGEGDAYVEPVSAGTITTECGIKAAHVLNPAPDPIVPDSSEVVPNFVDPVKVTLTAQKTLNGETPEGSEYTFVLKNEAGQTVQTVSNNGGAIVFAPLSFSDVGTYRYTISEVAGAEEGVTYDPTVYTAVITVTRGLEYTAELSYEKDGVALNGSPVFANTAEEAADTIALSVTKVWEDDGELRPDSVSVQLYCDGEAYGEPVTLSEEDGWSYVWTDLDSAFTYTVEELDVPEGYSSVVTHTGSDWTITNSAEEDVVPKTGDSSNGALIVLCLLAAAAVTVACGRKLREQNR